MRVNKLTAFGCLLMTNIAYAGLGFPYSWVQVETNNYRLVRNEGGMTGAVYDDRSSNYLSSNFKRFSGSLTFRFNAGPGTFKMCWEFDEMSCQYDEYVFIAVQNDGTNVFNVLNRATYVGYDGSSQLFECAFSEAGEHVITINQRYSRIYNQSWFLYGCPVSFTNIQWIPDSVTTTVGATDTTIPRSWIDGHVSAETLSAHDGDYSSVLKSTGSNGCTFAESYVAGLDPNDPASKFQVRLEITNGVPVVSWLPKLDDDATAKRIYTIYGRKSLSDNDKWTPIADGECNEYAFFKVGVSMRPTTK